MPDNRYALLFVRGERPVKDLKYDILKHPSVRMTTDGHRKSLQISSVYRGSLYQNGKALRQCLI